VRDAGAVQGHAHVQAAVSGGAAWLMVRAVCVMWERGTRPRPRASCCEWGDCVADGAGYVRDVGASCKATPECKLL